MVAEVEADPAQLELQPMINLAVRYTLHFVSAIRYLFSWTPVYSQTPPAYEGCPHLWLAVNKNSKYFKRACWR